VRKATSIQRPPKINREMDGVLSKAGPAAQLPARCSAGKLLATSLSLVSDSTEAVLQESLYMSEKEHRGIVTTTHLQDFPSTVLRFIVKSLI